MSAPLQAERPGRLPGAPMLATLNIGIAVFIVAAVVCIGRLGNPFDEASALDVAITATLLPPLWLAAWCGTRFGLAGYDPAQPNPPSWVEAARRGLLGGALSGPAFAGGLAVWAIMFGLVGTVVDPDRGTIGEIVREVPLYLFAVGIYSLFAVPPATLIGVVVGTVLGLVDRALFFGVRSAPVSDCPPTPPARRYR